MNKKLPDYSRCLVNLSSSILKRFGVSNNHKTLKEVDDVIYNYKKVIFVLFDAMGSFVLDKHLDKKSFIQSHKKCDISSVYPPTTAAATTAFLAAKNPNETGWLGWHMYFDSIQKDLVLFHGRDYYDESDETTFNITKDFLPYENIVSQISKNGYYAKDIYSFNGYEDLKDFKNAILNYSLNGKEGFMYAYFENPDHLMHLNGVTSAEAHDCILNINKALEEISEKMSDDTLIIVSADHGMIDVKPINLFYDEDIKENLIVKPYCDARVNMFRVKNKTKFYHDFRRKYGGAFDLYTKAEVKQNHLFGDLEDSKVFDDLLGDFICVGKKDYYLIYDENPEMIMKAHHSGMLEEEMTIPLIMFYK